MEGVVIRKGLSLFKDKRVLVTGDTGFKGSWLALWLKDLGANVIGYSLPPLYSEDHYNLINLQSQIHHVDGDIRDLSLLKKISAEFQPQIIFHLAAQALVRSSYEEPKLTFDTNVGGSVNLLEIAREATHLKAFIYVTSDKCYKNNEWPWGYRENDRLGGNDPYSASKAAAELVFEAYYKSYFTDKNSLGLASVRAGNVIGGGDWSEHRIVPDCIRALEAKRAIMVRNPTSIRPWQHVLEPLYGYLRLATCLYENPKKFSGAWNFGPSYQSQRKVEELAMKVIEYWGGGIIKSDAQDGLPHEAGILTLNCDKANRELGWLPQWNFEKTVEETVLWYKQRKMVPKVRDISLSQIRCYES